MASKVKVRQLNRVMSALSNNTRLKIVQHLYKNGPTKGADISELFEMTPANTSVALRKLAELRVVEEVDSQGRANVYDLSEDREGEITREILDSFSITDVDSIVTRATDDENGSGGESEEAAPPAPTARKNAGPKAAKS